MLLYDALEMSFTKLKVRKRPTLPGLRIPAEQVQLIDYEQFCGMPAHDHSNFHTTNGSTEPLEEITVTQLKSRLDAGNVPVIVMSATRTSGKL